MYVCSLVKPLSLSVYMMFAVVNAAMGYLCENYILCDTHMVSFTVVKER